MKKIICIGAALLMLLGCLAACGGSGREPKDTNGPLRIVATVFPGYDWVREILGENPAGAELTLLQDSGADLHSFQPSAADILKISTCDVFLYVGGESDAWVADALKEAANKDMVVIDLLDLLGERAKEEEHKEGMQEEDHRHGEEEHGEEEHGEEEHDEEEHDEEEHEHGEEPELDEHVWLSLKNASLFCGKIADALARKDPANAAVYKANAQAYREKLTALDEQYQSAAEKGARKVLLFGDRFPFRYLVDDYDLDYYAAFVGCSAETEASFETVTFLAGKVDELSLPCVMTIESGDTRIAQTIVANTKTKDQKVLRMDSMQSVTAADIQNGATYLALMEQNLAVLKEALG